MTIFLTVGLHEQPFDRIIKLVDELHGMGKIIQYGYSTTTPINAQSKQFMEFTEIIETMRSADVVITHGGTGSIMLALSLGKKPIVAPRYKKFNEHVDDHQFEIVEQLGKNGYIIPLLDGNELLPRIQLAEQGTREILSPFQRKIDHAIIECIEK